MTGYVLYSGYNFPTSDQYSDPLGPVSSTAFV